MRILALTNLYPNPAQPHRAPFNRQQFRALAAEHEVQVIAPIAWTDEWRARRAVPSLPRISKSKAETSKGFTVSALRVDVPSIIHAHHPRYAYTPGILRRYHGRFLLHSIRNCFHKVVHDFRPDIVLACWAYPDGFAAVQLAREANLPVVVKVHGSDLLSLADHPSRRPGTAAALASADAVIAVSRHLAGHAISLGADPAKTHIVYNGIDTTLFHPAPRQLARHRLEMEDGGWSLPRTSKSKAETSKDFKVSALSIEFPTPPLLLFVGNLVPVKGLDVLIDALASLAQTGTRFHAALIGDGPQKNELQAQINRAGLAQTVSLLGPRPLEQLPLWYQAADLLILPSHSEGIPNVLLEAIACQTPFIATRVGGIPEIAPPEALIPPGDPVALADRIRIFLHSPVPAPKPFQPLGWHDSARAVAAILTGVVDRSQLARAG